MRYVICKGSSKNTAPANDAVMLMGLVFACPLVAGNPPDCPLYEVRECAVAERVAWVQQLTGHERRQVLGWHTACLARKESQIGVRDFDAAQVSPESA